MPDPLDEGGFSRARPGLFLDALRTRPARPAESRLMAQLWSGFGEFQSAGFRRREWRHDSRERTGDLWQRVPAGPAPRLASRRVQRRRAAVSYTHLRAHETPEHLVCR